MIDDLVPLFAPAAAPPLFVQGTIVTFNQATGANTVRVRGTVLTDLPILSGGSESLEYAAGDAVLLIRLASTFAILGRFVTPGGQLATSAVAFAGASASANTFTVGTTINPPTSTKVTATLQVPPAYQGVGVGLAQVTAIFSGNLLNANNAFAVVSSMRAVIGADIGLTQSTTLDAMGMPMALGAFVASHLATLSDLGPTIAVLGQVACQNTLTPAQAANLANLVCTATFRRA